MLTRPRKSEDEAEIRCLEAEAERKLRPRPDTKRPRPEMLEKLPYKNTVECLCSNIKFINTKKSHPVTAYAPIAPPGYGHEEREVAILQHTSSS